MEDQENALKITGKLVTMVRNRHNLFKIEIQIEGSTVIAVVDMVPSTKSVFSGECVTWLDMRNKMWTKNNSIVIDTIDEKDQKELGSINCGIEINGIEMESVDMCIFDGLKNINVEMLLGIVFFLKE